MRKIPKSFLNKPVKLIWLDACFKRGWLTKNEVDTLDPTKVKHVGFLYAIKKDFIILVGAQNDAGQWSEAHAIRIADIASIKVLK